MALWRNEGTAASLLFFAAWTLTLLALHPDGTIARTAAEQFGAHVLGRAAKWSAVFWVDCGVIWSLGLGLQWLSRAADKLRTVLAEGKRLRNY
jgi:hypothetical protein